eukprot:GGOE01013735.1.p1 GENE.GGOE01013735.1~~GGOE01013735.1.p1  ORF type:complete len:197 (-),score=82.85 GGOE01013735.1:301-870(-)
MTDPRAKINKALELKELGNELLKAGNAQKACFQYKLALSFLKGFGASELGGEANAIMSMAQRSKKEKEASEEEKGEAKELSVVLNLNLAQANLKREKWDDAIRFASEALSLDENNAKGLYRRGKAYFSKGDLDGAKADWTTLHGIEPQTVAKELKQLEKAFAAHKQKEKAAFGKMFAGDGSSSTTASHP